MRDHRRGRWLKEVDISDLHGRWRQATRPPMVLLSLHGLPPSQIAELLECHPATVRRWITRFNREGLAGLGRVP